MPTVSRPLRAVGNSSGTVTVCSGFVCCGRLISVGESKCSFKNCGAIPAVAQVQQPKHTEKMCNGCSRCPHQCHRSAEVGCLCSNSFVLFSFLFFFNILLRRQNHVADFCETSDWRPFSSE